MTPSMPIPCGIDADTGQTLPPLDASDLASLAAATAAPAARSASGLGRLRSAAPTRGRFRGVTLPTVRQVDPDDLMQTGWGVLFGANVPVPVREALQPLIEHRRQQTDPRFFKVFEGENALQPGESARQWVERLGASLQTVDPTLGIPYYLLIVASPEDVPFDFQYVLDIHWAVGRLHFESPDEYRQYAASVIPAEAMAARRAREVALFATAHDGDAATQAFATFVANPLANGIGDIPPLGQPHGFAVKAFVGEQATKQQLVDLYTSRAPAQAPALLFTGTHGVAFRHDDVRLPALQGALLCQDWAGGRPQDTDWFAAGDVPANANVSGLIQVLFACYGGGCPAFDTYKRSTPPRRIAPHAMVARLPQALLAHPNGGALAVIGHVDRAFAHSFVTNGRGPQIQGFRDMIGRLLNGSRAGQAMDQFNQRWASLAADLSETLADTDPPPPPEEIANRWVARDDARNYILFGDPAVRLQV